MAQVIWAFVAILGEAFWFALWAAGEVFVILSFLACWPRLQQSGRILRVGLQPLPR